MRFFSSGCRTHSPGPESPRTFFLGLTSRKDTDMMGFDGSQHRSCPAVLIPAWGSPLTGEKICHDISNRPR